MEMSNQENLMEEINKALDEIRPHLAVDGGDIEVIDVDEDGQLRIKWLGNCQSCSMSSMTLKAGIEQTVKSKIPSISSVIAIN